jgi:hypothetical protein
MAFMINPLERLETDRFGRLVFTNREAFPYEEWVPSLVKIIGSQTMKEQQLALAQATFNVAASYYGLEISKRGRLRFRVNNLDARFRIPEVPSTPELAYISVGKVVGNVVSIGYQNPEDRPHPAFAVVDIEDKYHRVAGPTEELHQIEKYLNTTSVGILADTLDGRYPGWEIHQKLSNEGVE